MASSPSETTFNISTDNLSTLSHLSTLLHLFLARNKNQHRRSIWFRHFCVFRRNLSSLVQDLETLNSIPPSHAARVKKKSTDPILTTRNRARLDHWRDVLVPKWHNAFSQVIADQRFSVLGLFLLGVLAEVCQIVGITSELEGMGNEEVRRAIEAFGREELAMGAVSPIEENATREDAGEVIAREREPGIEGVPEEEKEEKEAPPPAGGDEVVKKGRKRAAEPTIEVKRKKKHRKKVGGDAIDDIFG